MHRSQIVNFSSQRENIPHCFCSIASLIAFGSYIQTQQALRQFCLQQCRDFVLIISFVSNLVVMVSKRPETQGSCEKCLFFSGDGEKINFEQETRPQQEECRLKVKLERTFAKFEII